MELGSLLLIAIIAVVLLLQIIALVQIAGMRKALGEIREIKAAPAPAPAPERFERKGGDFRRHEKRPFPDQRPRPASPNRASAATPAPAVAPAVAADPVETSLRDINLRLKNAERDQDFARKKIQENLGGDRDQHHRGHDRSDRDRNDRGNDRFREAGDREGGRDRNRGGREGNRDRNRGPRRDNWQPQGNRPSSQLSVPSATVSNTGDEQPTFEKQPFVGTPSVATQPPTATPVEQNAPTITSAPVAAAFSPAPLQQVADQASADFSGTEDTMEHGRKVLVKRRPLRDEGVEGSENRTSASEETAGDASGGSEAEIQFGRRKGR